MVIEINTLLLKDDKKGIQTGAELLKKGGLVAIPTETVYGLAANALDGKAVLKIFEAKGRAQDNPLIVHIADWSMIHELTTELPQQAYKLAKSFWPGPLTLVLKKSAAIPETVSCGLSTVGIRIPDNTIARDLIRACGFPLAAPSANLSGGVSPTTAEHCIVDLAGRVDGIIDGGSCIVGLESTVLSLAHDVPVILRPGYIGQEDIEAVIGPVSMDKTIFGQFTGEVPLAPGMKYKHYSPKAEVIVLKGTKSQYINYVNQNNGYALCFDEDCDELKVPFLSLGSEHDFATQASRLFSCLREFDQLGAEKIHARCPGSEGVGLAVYNRLLRAASFHVIEL